MSTSSEPIKESLPKFGSLDGQLEVQPVAGLSRNGGGVKLIYDVHFAVSHLTQAASRSFCYM